MFTNALLDTCELSLIGLPSLSMTREKPRSRTLLKLAASRSLPDDINLVCFLLIRFSIRFLNLVSNNCLFASKLLINTFENELFFNIKRMNNLNLK